MRKILHLITEEEIKSIAISNEAKDSVYDELILEYEQSVFQNLEFF